MKVKDLLEFLKNVDLESDVRIKCFRDAEAPARVLQVEIDRVILCEEDCRDDLG